MTLLARQELGEDDITAALQFRDDLGEGFDNPTDKDSAES